MHRIYGLSFAELYPLYVAKVERKGRTTDELDEVIEWLTGFDDAELRRHIESGTPLEEFFAAARMNPSASLITGVICGVRVEEIGISANTMFVDDYARVFTGESVKNMHFALDMKEGQKVLLITGKLSIMARFVAGYLIRRHEGDPELASFL